MRKLMASLASLFVFTGVATADIVGTWKTGEGENGGYAVVEIGLCADGSGTYCGTITDIVDIEDPESIGKPIITAMEDRGNGKYRGGRIYAPDQDRWYNSRMNLDGDILAVYGCVAGGLICRGQNWTRAN